MNGLFITSTGTEIGKTYVLTQLLRQDRLDQAILTASKPIITGWFEKAPVDSTDTGQILRALDQPITIDTIDAISPWRYTQPLTPAMAIPAENGVLDVSMVVEFSRQKAQQARSQGKIHCLEGVGGLMSPIWKQWTNLDWLKESGFACILVVGSYLGAISHTLTALEVLNHHRIPVVAVIVNETAHASVDLTATQTMLQGFMEPVPCLKVGWGEAQGFSKVLDLIKNYTRSLTLC